MARRTTGLAALVSTILVLGACSTGRTNPASEQGGTSSSDGSTAEIGSTLELVGAVGPPSAHPLSRIDRDAGVNAVLSDGSVVWFFGDTGKRNLDGSLASFEIGSAAWAPADDPLVTRDPRDAGRIEVFAAPTPEFPACPVHAPESGMWPLAAVTDPTDANRVLLWMANICLGSDRTVLDKGISVGEWLYDPADPPDGEPVAVTVLAQNLFPDARLGDAAVVVGDRIVVYGCEPPDSAGVVVLTPGECLAASVDPDSVEEPAAYEVWDGKGWSADGQAAAMEMPPGSDRSGAVAPPGPVSVAPTPDSGGYAMAYSPWPGFSPSVHLRVSRSPVGPWSPPHEVVLADCGTDSNGADACYAANLQPLLNDVGRLGIGYYDRSLGPTENRGGFLVGTVEFGFHP
ncbi:MAG: hypothetical protein ACK5O2_10735 [Microthrixaceae bacterium]